MTTQTKNTFTKPTTLESLKRHAKRLKREHKITHAAALERAAEMAGYANYRVAQAAFSSQSPSSSQRPLAGYEAHRQNLRDIWAEAIERLPAGATPVWRDQVEIIHVLHEVLQSGAGVCMLPVRGSVNFTGAQRGPEPHLIRLTTDDDIIHVTPSRYLELHRIAASPADSFLMLHLGILPMSGAYHEDDERLNAFWDNGQEDVAVAPDGTYHDRDLWRNGELPGARRMTRHLSGTMMFMSKGSLWNEVRGVEDGLHGKTTGEGITAFIETMIAREVLRSG